MGQILLKSCVRQVLFPGLPQNHLLAEGQDFAMASCCVPDSAIPALLESGPPGRQMYKVQSAPPRKHERQVGPSPCW